MTILIFNHKIAENYINLSNKEAFFEYDMYYTYEVIKYSQVWWNLLYFKALWSLLELIMVTPDCFCSLHKTLKMTPYSLISTNTGHFEYVIYYKRRRKKSY